MLDVPISVLDLSTVAEGTTTADALAGTIRLAQAADELGCRRFWTAEHHNMPMVAATSPAVLIAALGAHTKNIRLGSGGVMLPNHSPYVVAEQFSVLEGLYPGRIDLGLGRAPGTDQITAWALRRSMDGKGGAEDFPENVQLIRAWLSPDGVQTGMGQTLSASPAATGYPEMWLLGSSDFAARLAGRLGMRYCYAAHFGQLDPAAVMRLYRESFQASDDLAEPYGMVCTSAIVGATTEEAEYLAGPARVSWLGLRSNRLAAVVSPDEAARRLGEEAREIPATKYVGTAEQVRAGLARLVEDCEVAELMIAATAYDVETRIDTLRALVG